MHRYKKWLSRIPAELTLLGVAILFAAPVFPHAALCGAFSWIFGLFFYRLCKIGELKLIPVNMHLNLVAIGFALSFAQSPSLSLTAGICVASIATMLLTTLISRIFIYYWIPVLMLPALSVYWASKGLIAQTFDANITTPAWSLVYGIGASTLICLIVSPIFLAMFTAGLLIGTSFQFAFQLNIVYSWPLTVAQGITFACCACVFAMPSKRSMAWATLAVGILSICASTSQVLTNQPDLFNLFWWGTVASILSIYGSRMYSRYAYSSLRARPEDKLEDKMTQWLRFRAGEPRIGLPFKGTWKVSQGFDGAWTHRGIWQHGIDFIAVDEAGKSFQNNGYELSDYYAFGKEVLAPVSGYVVAMFQDFPDNPVGAVKNQNNFGNYVVIRDAYGAHVLLAHFKQGSLACSLYQFMEAGQVIGLCGNSGYSPEPHIHMHVQADAVVGHATIPFHLTNYLNAGQFHFHGVPETEQLITNLELNNSLSRSLGYRVDESFTIISKGTGPSKATRIQNQLDPLWGSMYFTDGSAKLFHYRDALTFYFYRYEGPQHGPLFDLMTALPRVPLIYGVKCSYDDLSPAMFWRSTWQRWSAFFQLVFIEKFVDVKTSFQLNCDTLEVKGLARSGGNGLETSCFLDPVEGFIEFNVGERKYEVQSLREHVVVGTNLHSRSAG